MAWLARDGGGQVLVRDTQHGPVDERTQHPAGDRRHPEQPELRQVVAAANSACEVERAGFTDVFVTGMEMRWISVSAKPMATGAVPAGAPLRVAPMITMRKTAVITTSHTRHASRL